MYNISPSLSLIGRSVASRETGFYIPELKMIIEADGKYGHLRKRDVKRDIALSKHDEVEYILHVRHFTKAKIKETLWQALDKLIK